MRVTVQGKFIIILAIFVYFFVFKNTVFADQFRSTSFISSDPVIFSGNYGTSTNFALIGSIAQISIGTSTASSYKVNSGFLYFPAVTSPIASATGGDSQVSLSWTTSVGSLGWNVSGYDVGQSTSSGGPYTFTVVGNVNSSIRSSLNNGTTYYFIIRPEDAFGHPIATSSEVFATPAAVSSPTPTPSPAPTGGGGGGPTSPTPSSSVVNAPLLNQFFLKGRTSPYAVLSIVQDGVTVAMPTADANGDWQVQISTGSGIYTFSIYAIDAENRRTLTSSFTTNVTLANSTSFSNIVVAPTISSDKSIVRQGNVITFFGASYPNSKVRLEINSKSTIIGNTITDKFGYYSYKMDSSSLDKGDHTAKIQVTTPDNITSPFSENVGFRVGDIDVVIGKTEAVSALQGPSCSKKGDINKDGKINIIDFSILLYFWGQTHPKNVCANVKQYGAVGPVDLSIMLYWWTG